MPGILESYKDLQSPYARELQKLMLDWVNEIITACSSPEALLRINSHDNFIDKILDRSLMQKIGVDAEIRDKMYAELYHKIKVACVSTPTQERLNDISNGFKKFMSLMMLNAAQQIEKAEAGYLKGGFYKRAREWQGLFKMDVTLTTTTPNQPEPETKRPRNN